MDKTNQTPIFKQYTKAIKYYQGGDFTNSKEIFNTIIEKYSDTNDDLIQQLLAKSKINVSIIEAKGAKKSSPPKTPEDKLNQGIYSLNSGNYEEALKLFNNLITQKFNIPYIYYLMSIAYLKAEETDNSLEYLKKAIDQDEFYRILAFNELDFEPLADNEDYINLVQILESE